MIGSGFPSFPFTKVSIVANAPKASGVYAISNPQKYIYVGESRNIQARLLEHYNGDNLCITVHRPTGFQFELSPDKLREALQDELVVKLKVPDCNKIPG